MAEVTLTLGERRHIVACRDGEEARLRQLGAMLDERWAMASRAAGGLGTERALLITALMLADSLDEAQQRPPVDGGINDAALERLATRLEAIATALEEPAPAS